MSTPKKADDEIKIAVPMIHGITWQSVTGAIEDVVGADLLAQASADGWRVVETVRMQRVRPAFQHGHAGHVIDDVAFRIARSADTARDEIIAQLNEAHASNTALLHAVREAADTAGELELQVSSLRAQLRIRSKEVTRYEEERADVQRALHRMEADVAKVREAVGSDRMREILGRDAAAESSGGGGGVGVEVAIVLDGKGGMNRVDARGNVIGAFEYGCAGGDLSGSRTVR